MKRQIIHFARWLQCYLSTDAVCERPGARRDRRSPVSAWLCFDVILRVTLLCNASITCALAWLVPTSLTATLLRAGGAEGHAVSVAMLALVLLSWFDVLINDVAPEPFTFRAAKSRRHLLYSGLSVMYLLQAFASVGDSFDMADVLSVGYVATGLVCAWYSLAVALRGGYE